MFTGPGHYVIWSLHRPAMCLDIPSEIAHKEAGRVQMFPRNGAAYQRWVIAKGGERAGCFVIHASVGKSKTLGVAGRSVADLARVEFQQPDGSTSQLWRLVHERGEGYRIINDASGLCLDLREEAVGQGGVLQQRPTLDVPNQLWGLEGKR